MPRPDIKKAPANIRRDFMSAMLEDGAYAAVQRALSLGFYVGDLDALCPLHREFGRYMAEGDAASAYVIKNSDIARWHDESTAIDTIRARKHWAETTSAEDDHKVHVADAEKERAEARERYAVARANEQRDAEARAAHTARVDQARKDFDLQHPPLTGARKEART